MEGGIGYTQGYYEYAYEITATYLLISLLGAVDSDDLGSCLVGLIAVLNKLLLEASVVLDVRRLVDSTFNCLGS